MPVEITQNMGLEGISRIEEYFPVANGNAEHDPMLQRMYDGIDQKIFEIDKKPDPIVYIDDIVAYNAQEGLALSEEEVKYLNDLSKKLGRKLTDSEVFGFSQVNSEHCRHKIFNGVFIIDGEERKVRFLNSSKEHRKRIPISSFRPIKTMSLSTKARLSNSLHRLRKTSPTFSR